MYTNIPYDEFQELSARYDGPIPTQAPRPDVTRFLEREVFKSRAVTRESIARFRKTGSEFDKQWIVRGWENYRSAQKGLRGMA